MIKPGDEWGTGTDDAPDFDVCGDDAAFAASITVDGSVPLVRWSPVDSDFARSVGLHPDHQSPGPRAGGIELPVDTSRSNSRQKSMGSTQW